jgi:hypothetical protein
MLSNIFRLKAHLTLKMLALFLKEKKALKEHRQPRKQDTGFGRYREKMGKYLYSDFVELTSRKLVAKSHFYP